MIKISFKSIIIRTANHNFKILRGYFFKKYIQKANILTISVFTEKQINVLGTIDFKCFLVKKFHRVIVRLS